MQTTSNLLPKFVTQTVNRFITLQDGKLVGNAQTVGLQLAKYLGQVIQKDGNLHLPDKEAGTNQVFPALEFINLVKQQVSDVLKADQDSSKIINASIDANVGAAFEHSAAKPIIDFFKNPKNLKEAQKALGEIKLKEGEATSNGSKILGAMLLEVTKNLQESENLAVKLAAKIQSGAEERGLTQGDLKAFIGETKMAGIFLNAKYAASKGLSSENLIVVYKEANFDEKSALEGFANGSRELNETQVEQVSLALEKYLATSQKDPETAKAQLEHDLSKMEDEQKAFAKYAIGVGNKLNSEIDLDEVFNQLGNFLPGLLGSGIIGYIFSSLLGVSGVWGVVGSLVMTALAATDDSKQKPPAFKVTTVENDEKFQRQNKQNPAKQTAA